MAPDWPHAIRRLPTTLYDRASTYSRRLHDTLTLVRGTSLADLPTYDPDTHPPLTTFEPLPGQHEVERYWVNKPYAFVVITYDDDTQHHAYHCCEPDLTPTEETLLSNLLTDARSALIYNEHLQTTATDTDPLREQLRILLEQYAAAVTPATFERLYYYLHRAFRGYGKIDPLMHDPHIEDISCDGSDVPVFVYHDDYNDMQTNIEYASDTLESFIIRLAQQSGRHISLGSPAVEATLPDGSRAELALGDEITPRGSAYTIRRYSDDPLTPIDLLQHNTYNVEQLAFLWLCIEHNKSLLFAGGTASGKTTSLNAVSMFIPPQAKVITIEDTRELTLYHENWLAELTRDHLADGSPITMYDLLRSALRHRPEYLIVGEVRGEEAMTLFQAMNTGHTTYSTLHADSVQTVVNRLENDPINVPRSMIRSLDIISIQNLTRLGDDRVRRTDTVAEITDFDQQTGDLDYTELYHWTPVSDTFDGNLARSQVVRDIQTDLGVSRSAIQTELECRQTVLSYLAATDVTDYKSFTRVVNEYYADPDAVLTRIRDDPAFTDPVPDAPTTLQTTRTPSSPP